MMNVRVYRVRMEEHAEMVQTHLTAHATRDFKGNTVK